MPVLNGVGRTAIDPKDLSTFSAPPRHQRLSGPARLYRFGKSRGKWWFDPELMGALKEDFLDSVYGGVPGQKRDDGVQFARYSLAVSREWNKLSWISALTLKPGEQLDCFVGPAAPQPEWQNQVNGPMLGGGLLQYVVYEIGLVPTANFSEMSTMSLFRKWSR